jgi:hypothetical protein
MELSKYSTKQLEQELKSREVISNRPVIKNECKDEVYCYSSLKEIIIMMEASIDEAIEEGYFRSEDIEHYLYEAVITQIYGDSFWKWRSTLK